MLIRELNEGNCIRRPFTWRRRYPSSITSAGTQLREVATLKTYPITTYFKNVPITSKNGQRGLLTIKTLPPEYLTDPKLIEEGTLLYNRGWNPEEDPTKAALFHITEEQFVQAARNSLGEIIISSVNINGKDELVGAIWSLHLDYPGRTSFWKTYNEIVTPKNYFGNHDFYGNSKHCVAVVVKKEFNGYLTDKPFPVGYEEKKLSIGQMAVLAQRKASRRSPYVFILFADSKPSSLKYFIEENFVAPLDFDKEGRIFLSYTEGKPLEVLADKVGLYFSELPGNRRPLVNLKEYFPAKRILKTGEETTYDLMVRFHAAGLGGEPFIILPHSRTQTLADGRKVIDEDALGYNLIFKFNILTNFFDFMADLSPGQQLFIKNLARYLLNPNTFEKSSEKIIRQTLKFLDYSPYFLHPAFQKTLLGNAFSIEKTSGLRSYLINNPEECKKTAEFTID